MEKSIKNMPETIIPDHRVNVLPSSSIGSLPHPPRSIFSNLRHLILLTLIVCGVGNVWGQGTPSSYKVKFNDAVRYSQWAIDSRANDFKGNTKQFGFKMFNTDGSQKKAAPTWGSKDTDKSAKLDYVAGLVAKAIIENAAYYQNYSWSTPYFRSVEWYTQNIADVPNSGGSLDNLNAAKMYFELYNLASSKSASASTTQTNAKTQLGKAVTGLAAHANAYSFGKYANSPTTVNGYSVEGGWFHKSNYLNQMWLDGSYMGPALLAQLIKGKSTYSIADNDILAWNIVANQFTVLRNQVWDSNKKLPYHAFTGDRSAAITAGWSLDDNTYHSKAFWGRAVGWYFLALVDVLESMPTDNGNYNTLKGYLTETAAGLAQYQTSNGCWYQVLDEKDDALTGNYEEASASCIFAAAYLKAIRLGYLTAGSTPSGCSKTYEQIAKAAYQGCVEQFMVFDTDNKTIQLINSCASAGLGGDSKRSGTREYYVDQSQDSKKITTYTEGKPLGAFILAATEYERLYQNGTNLKFTSDLKDWTKASDYKYTMNGTTDALSATAEGGSGTVQYQWVKGNTDISGATSSSYIPTESANYCLKASTDGSNWIYTTTAYVEVAETAAGGETIYWNTTKSTTSTNTDLVSVTTGNYKDGLSVSFDGNTYTDGVKMESSTSIAIKPTSTCNVTFVFDTSNTAFKIDNTSYTTGSDGTKTIELTAGTHTLTKGVSMNLVAVKFASSSTPTTYAINCGSPSNGSVTASPTTAASGASVTLTITPNAGYKLSSISATDASSNSVELSGSGNTRTFTMPASAVNVSASFVAMETSTATTFSSGNLNGTTLTVPAHASGTTGQQSLTITKATGASYEIVSASTTAANVSLNGTTLNYDAPADGQSKVITLRVTPEYGDAVDYTINVSTAAAQQGGDTSANVADSGNITATTTLSNNNKTCTWTNVSATAKVNKGTSSYGNGLGIIASSSNGVDAGTITTLSKVATLYVKVPSATSTGTISIYKASADANDRTLTLKGGNTMTQKKTEAQNVSFSSNDIVNVNGGYYIQLSNSGTDFKYSDIVVTLTKDGETYTNSAPSSTYTVTYDANGATTGTAPTDANEYEANASVTTAYVGSLMKSEANFAGWNTAADGSGTQYAENATFSITANTTLYAQWKAHTVFNGTTIGTEATTGKTWWTEFSPSYTINKGQTRHFSFVNHGGTDNWNNWVLAIANKEGHGAQDAEGYSEYMILRADNWGWGSSFNRDNSDGKTVQGNIVVPAEFDSYISALKNSGQVEMDVTLNEAGTQITAVAKVGDYTYTATSGEFTAVDNVYSFLTVDNSYLTEFCSRIPLTGFTLDKSTANVNIGSTVRITPTFTPADATNRVLNWTSSDESKATVSGGVVTGVAAGEVTITATSEENSSLTQSCTVTVKEAQGIVYNLSVGTSTKNEMSTASQSSSYSEITNVTGIAYNGVATATSSYKAGLTDKIATATEYSDNDYVAVSFTVASGKKFTPSAITATLQTIATTKNARFTMSDDNGHSMSKTFNSLTAGDAVERTWYSSDTYFTGNVTLKITCYGATDGYRLGSTINIEGAVSDLATEWTYTLNAVDASNNVIATIKTGKATTGLTIFHPYIIKGNDGKYYKTSTTGDYSHTFSAAGTQNVTYTLDESIVAFAEGEDAVSNSENNASYSGGSTGHVAAQNYSCRGLFVGNLPAGTYKMVTNLTANHRRAVALRQSTGASESYIAPILAYVSGSTGEQTSSVFGIASDNSPVSANGYDATEPKVNQSEDFDYLYIIKADGLVIIEQPQDQSCSIGGTAPTLTCVGLANNGSATPNYQWMKYDGSQYYVDIDGATSSTYTPDVSEEGAYYYACKVTYNEETINSNACAVIVSGVPDIEFHSNRYKVEPTQTYASNQKIFTNLDGRNLTMQFSPTMGQSTFGATGLTNNSITDYKYRVVADNCDNPIYNATTGVPSAGAYYAFTVTSPGLLTVPMYLGADKQLVISNSSKIFTAGIDYQYNFPTTAGGDSQVMNDNKVAENSAGTVSFSVQPGKTYYIYGVGTKLAIQGFEINELPTYTITATADPSAGGSVSIVNGNDEEVASGSTVNAGTKLIITAETNSGYVFDGWKNNGEVVSTSSTYTVDALNTNLSLVATFHENTVQYGSATFTLDELKTFGKSSSTSNASVQNAAQNFTISTAEDVSTTGMIEQNTKGAKTKQGATFTITPIAGLKIKSVQFITDPSNRQITATTPTATADATGATYTFTYDNLTAGQAVSFENASNSGGNIYLTAINIIYETTGSSEVKQLRPAFANSLSIERYVGETGVSVPALSVTYNGQEIESEYYTVSYSSSNTTAVTVEENTGALTFNAAGNAVITATITPTSEGTSAGYTAGTPATVPIVVKALEEITVTAGDINFYSNEQVYSQPDVIVSVGGDVLSADKYTVAYTVKSGTNVTVSDGQLVVTGTAGNYTAGSSIITATVTIKNPAELHTASSASTDFTVEVENAASKQKPVFSGVASEIVFNAESTKTITANLVYNGNNVNDYYDFSFSTITSSASIASQSQNKNVLTVTPSATTGSTSLTISATVKTAYVDQFDNPDNITVTITVADYANNLVVTATPTSHTIKLGETAKSALTVKDVVKATSAEEILDDEDYSVSYSSSDVKVASVNAQTGLITGLSDGTATIKVVVTKAERASVSTSITVTVTDPSKFKVDATTYATTGPKNGTILTTENKDCSLTLGGWVFNNVTDVAVSGKASELISNSWTKSTKEKFVAPGFGYYIPFGDGKNPRNEDGNNSQPESVNLYNGDMSTTYTQTAIDPMFNVPCGGSYLEFAAKTNGTVKATIFQNGVFDYASSKEVYRPQRRVFVVDESGTLIQSTPRLVTTTGKFESGHKDYTTYPCDISGVKASDVATHFGLSSFASDDENFNNGVYENKMNNTVLKNQAVTNGKSFPGARGWSIMVPGPVEYTFKVQAGKSYYLYNWGSKIGLYGYQFIADENVAIDNVTYTQDGNNTLVATAAGHVATVNISDRTYKAGFWNAGVLPFSLNKQQVDAIFGQTYDKNHTDGTQIIYYDHTDGTKIHFTRHAYNTIVAGKPFLIKPTKDAIVCSENMGNFPYVTIEKTSTPALWGREDGHGYKWRSDYNTVNMKYGSYYIGSDGYIYRYITNDKTATVTIKGFRGFLEPQTETAQNAKVMTISMTSFDDESGNATDIGMVYIDDDGSMNPIEDGKIYNMSGQVVGEHATDLNTLPKGLYILNGKKYLIK